MDQVRPLLHDLMPKPPARPLTVKKPPAVVRNTDQVIPIVPAEADVHLICPAVAGRVVHSFPDNLIKMGQMIQGQGRLGDVSMDPALYGEGLFNMAGILPKGIHESRRRHIQRDKPLGYVFGFFDGLVDQGLDFKGQGGVRVFRSDQAGRQKAGQGFHPGQVGSEFIVKKPAHMAAFLFTDPGDLPFQFFLGGQVGDGCHALPGSFHQRHGQEAFLDVPVGHNDPAGIVSGGLVRVLPPEAVVLDHGFPVRHGNQVREFHPVFHHLLVKSRDPRQLGIDKADGHVFFDQNSGRARIFKQGSVKGAGVVDNGVSFSSGLKQSV